MHRRLETTFSTVECNLPWNNQKQRFISLILISHHCSHSLIPSLGHSTTTAPSHSRCSLGLSLLVCVWKQTSKPNYVFNFAKQQEMSGPDPDIDTRALPTLQSEDGHKLQQRL